MLSRVRSLWTPSLALAAAACSAGVTTKQHTSSESPLVESAVSSDSAPTCPTGIPVTGVLEDSFNYRYDEYQQHFCHDSTVEAVAGVCAELFGTPGCPTLDEFVRVTDWFGDSPFLNRQLFLCDQQLQAPDIDTAYFDQIVGPTTHLWVAHFDHLTGAFTTITRNAYAADGMPEYKLCCEGTLVDIADYDAWDAHYDTGCETRTPYTAADFGLCGEHTGCTHSGAR